MTKSLEDFLSYAECFPSAIADAVGNSWKPTDVLEICEEIRKGCNLPPRAKKPVPHPGMGAIDPKLSNHIIQQEAAHHASGSSVDAMMAKVSAEVTAEAQERKK